MDPPPFAHKSPLYTVTIVKCCSRLLFQIGIMAHSLKDLGNCLRDHSSLTIYSILSGVSTTLPAALSPCLNPPALYIVMLSAQLWACSLTHSISIPSRMLRYADMRLQLGFKSCGQGGVKTRKGGKQPVHPWSKSTWKQAGGEKVQSVGHQNHHTTHVVPNGSQ